MLMQHRQSMLPSSACKVCVFMTNSFIFFVFFVLAHDNSLHTLLLHCLVLRVCL